MFDANTVYTPYKALKRVTGEHSMEILPIGIEHANQFNEVITAIASEDIFAIQPDTLSVKSVHRFIERQLVEGAPMFIALDNERLVGWCEISLSDTAYSEHSGVLSMGILTGYRGQGVGSWLIRKCISAGRSMGIERIELSVLENNPEAHRFYLGKGFKVEGKKLRSLCINGIYHHETLMALIIPARKSYNLNQ